MTVTSLLLRHLHLELIVSVSDVYVLQIMNGCEVYMYPSAYCIDVCIVMWYVLLGCHVRFLQSFVSIMRIR